MRPAAWLVLWCLLTAQVRPPTARDRLAAVPEIASLVYSNLPTHEDEGTPPAIEAVGPRRTVLRVRWGGCALGTIAFNLQPIDGFEERLRAAGFREVWCDQPDPRQPDDRWRL